MNNEEPEYKALSLLESNPEISRRQVSAEVGASLGKAHSALKALIDVERLGQRAKLRGYSMDHEGLQETER